MGNKYYKSKALEILRGTWGLEIGIVLIVTVVSMIQNYIAEAEMNLIIIIGAHLISVAVNMGYYKHVILKVRNEPNELPDVVYFLTNTEIFGILGVSILVGLATGLGLLLFLIPGIIISIMYALAQYIKIEYPEKGVIEVIKDSENAMRGHKMEYFTLTLSFLGWLILGAVTIVGIIPVVVYMTTTMIVYYTERIDEYYGVSEEN